MVAVSLPLVLIICILSLISNILVFILISGRTSTLIGQLNNFDTALAELFVRLNGVLENFEGNMPNFEPINPIQALIAQYLGSQLDKNNTLNIKDRNEMGQFKTIEVEENGT